MALLRLLIPVLALAVSATAATNLGAPLTLDGPTPIPTILAAPDSYVGKTVQVKGKIGAVCEMMGCWMNVVDPKSGKHIRIKVKDGEIVFPAKAIGKTALAEGKLVKIDLTTEQAVARAKHEAEEQGRSFNPDSVKGPVSFYQISGTGAVVLD